MSSVLTYLQNSWSRNNPDAASKENWETTMDVVEKDRQREFVWRTVDPAGAQKARSHQYLYNLEVYGHKVYSRRSAKDIASANEENNRRVEAGELGPLSPLD